MEKIEQIQTETTDIDTSTVNQSSGEIFFDPLTSPLNKEYMDGETDNFLKTGMTDLARVNEILEQALNFRTIERNDNFRVDNVAKGGGFDLDDVAVLAKYRSAFKDLLG